MYRYWRVRKNRIPTANISAFQRAVDNESIDGFERAAKSYYGDVLDWARAQFPRGGKVYNEFEDVFMPRRFETPNDLLPSLRKTLSFMTYAKAAKLRPLEDSLREFKSAMAVMSNDKSSERMRTRIYPFRDFSVRFNVRLFDKLDSMEISEAVRHLHRYINAMLDAVKAYSIETHLPGATADLKNRMRILETTSDLKELSSRMLGGREVNFHRNDEATKLLKQVYRPHFDRIWQVADRISEMAGKPRVDWAGEYDRSNRGRHRGRD